MATEGISQSPTTNTDATTRVQVTLAPRPADACYPEEVVVAVYKRFIFTVVDTPLAGPVIYQVAPPSDLSAIWFPLDSSAGYAAGVPHIWNGAAWVPTANQTAISPDSNNAIFLDPSGALKVNLPARLRKEVNLTGPNPAVVMNWDESEYSLGDETPIAGFIMVGANPVAAMSFVESARTSTSITGTLVGLGAAETVTLVLEFNSPMTKGD